MKPSITLLEATALYLKALDTAGKSKRTLYTYGKDLEQIQTFFGPERPVQTMTLPLMGRFLKSDELLKLPNGKERAHQTVAKTIRVFRMFLAWLYQAGVLEELHFPKSIPMGRTSIEKFPLK